MLNTIFCSSFVAVKKYLFLLLALMLMNTNGFTQGVTYDFSNMTLTSDCDAAGFYLSEQAVIGVSWDIFDCSKGLTFTFENFEILSDNPQVEILNNISNYCWTMVGDADLDNCVFGGNQNFLFELENSEFTFFPSPGVVDVSMDFFILYVDPATGITFPCFVTLVFDNPIQFECPCADFESVSIIVEQSDCYQDNCSGEFYCDFHLELVFEGTVATEFLEVQWFQNGDLFATELGSTETDLTGCQGCGDITAQITYKELCNFEAAPVPADCEDTGNCSQGIGAEVTIQSILQDCIVDPVNGQCIYNLSLVPLGGTPVTFEDVVWTVNGVEYTTPSFSITVVPGTVSVEVVATILGNGTSCDYSESIDLICNATICNDPCSIAENLEIVLESVDCLGDDGCVFQLGLSDPSIYSFITSIDWHWITRPYGGQVETGNGSTIAAPTLSWVDVGVIIKLSTGCVLNLQWSDICDDYACEDPCIPTAYISSAGGTNCYCYYNLNILGCHNILNTYENIVPTYNLTVTGSRDGLGNSEYNVDGIPYLGYPAVWFYVSCIDYIDVEFELFYDNQLIFSFSETNITCSDPEYCNEDCPLLRPDGEGDSGGERAAAIDGINTYSIAPNPSSGTLELRLEKTDLGQENTLEVYDMAGKLLLTEVIPSGTISHQLNIDHLANGLYMFAIKNGGASVHQQLIFLAK